MFSVNRALVYGLSSLKGIDIQAMSMIRDPIDRFKCKGTVLDYGVELLL